MGKRRARFWSSVQLMDLMSLIWAKAESTEGAGESLSWGGGGGSGGEGDDVGCARPSQGGGCQPPHIDLRGGGGGESFLK